MDRSIPVPKAAATASKAESVDANANPTGATKAPGRGRGRNIWSKKKRLTSAGAGIHPNKQSAPKVKFPGECKKELQGVVIVWISNIPHMTKQYSDFNRCVITMVGKTGSLMGVSIERQEKLGYMSFIPKERDETDWTDNDGKFNQSKKDYADGMASYELKQISVTIRKYKNDWNTMFPWILGQVCPDTQVHLFRFKD